jgi:hypothetical protein
MADGWCWFVLRENTVAWLLMACLVREKKHRWLLVDMQATAW